MENQRLSEQDSKRMRGLLEESSFQPSWSSSDIQSLLTLDTTASWGRAYKGKLISFILIQKVASEVEIILLVTHPSHRKKGIAGLLLEEVVKYLREEEISRIFLEVSVENTPAISFYKSHAFEIIGERKNYYSRKNNKSANVMMRLI
ncbi:GNAT family N-acetyltransferase [Alphaproteobacteria bacterium]|nr:GNAT family N-acetyltransferase [Alphaproteobacteria bacterium]